MPEWNKVATLQYMGNKSRMLDSICSPIVNNDNINTVVDLFAGTGTVGFALAPYKRIISNDLEYYAYVLNQALLNGCMISEKEINNLIRTAKDKCQNMEKYVSHAISEEKRLFLIEDDRYEEYAYFSNNTPSVFNPNTNIESLKQLENLVKRIVPGSKNQDVPFECLFVTYFANAYFGINQCCQIDSIVAGINSLKDVRQRYVLFAALMSALSNTASTTTHFAQFLKVNSKSTFRNIREKRSSDIFLLFEEAIKRFNENGLLDKQGRECECFNLDYVECLKNLQLDSSTLVYADPPYFKEHYSRYYHVLNTLCLYDYPELAINPRTGGFSIGRYRSNRTSSDFGKKSKVLVAFKDLIDLCADKKASLMISYSENSLVKIFEILKLAKTRYKVRLDKVELKHSSQGRTTESGRIVNEYIFYCTYPDDKDIDIEVAAERIKNVKPVVDNPAGFIHNYMARKPYNVVSAIIRDFSDENDLIYDPMFGSGTSIIEASKLGRRVVGADINPLAVDLCSISLKKWNLDKLFRIIDAFNNKVGKECMSIYSLKVNDEERIIERCHFNVVDDDLVPTSYWYKISNGKKLSGRKKAEADNYICKNYNLYSNVSLKRISDHDLIPNSRIAIKEGTTVFSYFCNRNLLALDRIFSILDGFKEEYGYEVLKTIVSSSINLIKLSDKKASSQIPFWLPQKDVTSRNAVFVIEQKADAMKKGLQYLSENCKSFIDDGNVTLYNVPAQNINEDAIPDESIDLVITDPPYTDQVPYLEYHQLWFCLNNMTNLVALDDELVVSDAPSRNKGYEDFCTRLDEIIMRTARTLKKQGIFVMFYHTFDLKSWQSILTLMEKYGLRYVYQIPTAAPRKSFKTVMSPRSTLDGNYLIFFVKENISSHVLFNGDIQDAAELAKKCAERIILSGENVTTQDLYDKGMLKEAFEEGYLGILAEKYKTFTDVIKDNFVFEEGYWKVGK